MKIKQVYYRLGLRDLRSLLSVYVLSLLTAFSADPLLAETPPSSTMPSTVYVGLKILSISGLNEQNRTVEADFELWVRYAGTFDATTLVIADVNSDKILNTPVETFAKDTIHYQRFLVKTTLHYEQSKQDIAKERVVIAIPITLKNNFSSVDIKLQPDYMGMEIASGPGRTWLSVLQKDAVLAGLTGWSLQDASFSLQHIPGAPMGNPRYLSGKSESELLVGSLLIQRQVSSPKAIFLLLIPDSVSTASTLIAFLLFVAMRLPMLSKVNKKLTIPLRIISTAYLIYCAEAYFTEYAIDHFDIEQISLLEAVSRSIWWMLPALWIHSLLPLFVWAPITRRSGHPIPAITRTFVAIFIYGAALLIVMSSVFGYSVMNIWTASGVMAIILGIALQNLILDAFSGMLLNLERPFKMLHWIKVAEHEGQVIEMNWRATRLLTRSNNIVSIPNSSLTKSVIINYAMPSAPCRQEFIIELDSSVPIELARQLIRDGLIASTLSGRVLSAPQPYVEVLDLSKGRTVQYKALLYVDQNLVAASVAITDAAQAVIKRLSLDGIHLSTEQMLAGKLTDTDRQEVTEDSTTETDALDIGHLDTSPSRAGNPSATRLPAPADSVISDIHMRLIRESWIKLAADADNMAQFFYKRLFEIDPSLIPLFRTEKEVQYRKLVKMLDLVVRGLADFDGLKATVQNLGLRHVTYGVKEHHFDSVAQALLESLARSLGSDFDQEMKNAWIVVYVILSGEMKSVMNP